MDGLPLTLLDGRSDSGRDVSNDGLFVRLNVGRRVRIKVGRLVSGLFVGCLTGFNEFIGFIVGLIVGGGDGRRVRLEVGGFVNSNDGCGVKRDDVGAERTSKS